MTICAYCKREGPMTREHVIPSFLYKFQKTLSNKVQGWSDVAKKMVGGEFKVKDVCESCNSGPLSSLDAYGNRLLEESGVLVPNYTKLYLELRYDYDQLVRWLLKISFNSSRTDGVHAPLFLEYVPYMLGEGSTPPRSKIAVCAYLAAPLAPSASERQLMPELSALASKGPLNPFLVRISYGAVASTNFTLRLVCFGPLVFYILVFNNEVQPGHAAAAVRKIMKTQPGMVEVSPSRTWLAMRVGRASWVDLYSLQIARDRHLRKSRLT